MMRRKSLITSLSSYKITKSEKKILKENNPWGIILFKRNIRNLKQLKELTTEIKYLMHDNLYPILIDEEGGRVSRLSSIIDTRGFDQNYFGKIYEKNKSIAINSYIEYLTLNCEFLNEAGINMNTIPVLDILKKKSNNVIGDRSYSDKINIINNLKNICFKVLKKHKIGSVSKHIPGHGSSKVDTHKEISIINYDKNYLFKNDFAVFKNIDQKFCMTSHIIFKDIDPFYPVTLSSKMIMLIRNYIKFKGIIISDDISMRALSKNLVFNAKKAIQSGCNLILYCKGNLDESTLLLRKIGYIDDFTKKKTSEFYKFLS